MFCQKCGTQNPEDVKFCSKCGNDLKSVKVETERKGITGKLGKMGIPGFRSGKGWKMGLALIGYFFIFMILFGAIFGSNNSGTKTPSAIKATQNVPSIQTPIASTPIASTPIAASTPPIELNLNVGETAITSKTEVTVITAQKVKSYNYYSDVFKETNTKEVSPGKIYILVDAEIKNIDSNSAYVGYTKFSITDSEGYKYDATLYYGQDGLEAFKELYQNQKMKGKILFEVPENSQNLKLQYDFGNLFAGTKLASWTVK